MDQDEDFFVEDEPIEDVRAAWRKGEGGITKGHRDLNQQARSIVDRAVERLDAVPHSTETVVVSLQAEERSD